MRDIIVFHPGTGTILPLNDEVYLIDYASLSEEEQGMVDYGNIDLDEIETYRLSNHLVGYQYFGDEIDDSDDYLVGIPTTSIPLDVVVDPNEDFGELLGNDSYHRRIRRVLGFDDEDFGDSEAWTLEEVEYLKKALAEWKPVAPE